MALKARVTLGTARGALCARGMFPVKPSQRRKISRHRAATWRWVPGRTCLPITSGIRASTSTSPPTAASRASRSALKNRAISTGSVERALTLIPVASARLVAAAGRFVQYPISRDDVLATVGVAHETVRVNEGAGEHPPYLLLSDEFFDATFAEVGDLLERLYRERSGCR